MSEYAIIEFPGVAVHRAARGPCDDFEGLAATGATS